MSAPPRHIQAFREIRDEAERLAETSSKRGTDAKELPENAREIGGPAKGPEDDRGRATTPAR